MRATHAKNLKALTAALLFILLTAVKLLFPEQTEPARTALRELISQDADYVSVFRELGASLNAVRFTPERDVEAWEPVTLQELIEEQTAILPSGEVAASPETTAEPSAGPAVSPTPQPTEEPVPEAVSAFLDAQSEFSAYQVPSNVSYSYPALPFDYVSPVAGMTSSGFGYRLHPLRNEVLFHYGTDFAAWTGTEILAFAGGTVGMVGWDAGYGNYIIIQHAGGWRTLYAHCSAVYVTGGDTVTAGQCIGLVGATGNVTGPHLHLELTCDGVYYNPEFYLG